MICLNGKWHLLLLDYGLYYAFDVADVVSSGGSDKNKSW